MFHIRRRMMWIVCLGISLSLTSLGCSPGDSYSESGDSNGSTENSTKQDKEIQEEIVESMFGKIELKKWPNLTGHSVSEHLTAEKVQEIIGVQHEVTVTRDEGFPEWKYRWKSPDNKERGSVTVSLMFENMDSTQMKIQAGTRLNMVKSGGGEEFDLSKYGVVGVYRTLKHTGDLQICTANKILIINAKLMKGRGFDDQETIKEATNQMAQALFESLAAGNP